MMDMRSLWGGFVEAPISLNFSPMDLAALRARLPPDLAASLQTGADVERTERERHRGTASGPWRATTLAPLDELLGGGLRRAAITEIWGSPSCGRLAIALAALAAATRDGESVALIDLGAGLDPALASLAGVVLERLLWVAPQTVREALVAAEIVASIGLGLVVLDLGLADRRAVTERGLEASWARLAQAAAAHGSALVVLSPARASGSGARAVVRATRARVEWLASGVPARLLAGIVAELVLEKQRGAFPGESARLACWLPEVSGKEVLTARVVGAMEAGASPERLRMVHAASAARRAT